FSLLAILVSVMFYEDLVGPKTGGVRAYYAGEVETQPPSVASGGPKLDVPDEAPRMTVAVSYRKLLEVTHFHLFTVPVFLLIIAHLFMLTGLSVRTKSFFIAAAWLSSLLHLAAPWLIRYASPRLAWLYPSSGALMGVTM